MPLNRPELPTPLEFKKNKLFAGASEQVRNVIKVWNNQISDFELTKAFLHKNHEKIYNWINDYEYTKGNTTKKYSMNTKKEHYRVLGYLMNEIGNETLSKRYYDRRDKLKELLDEQAGEGMFISETRKENFVPFVELSRVREEYKKLWIQDPKNHKYHLVWLTLALYTLQPPLRGDWADMDIYNASVDQLPSKDQNYIFLDNGKWRVQLNYDKMTSRQKQTAKKYRKKYINVEIPLTDPLWKKVSGSNENADDAIKLSMNHLTRNFVLFAPTDKNKPIPEQTLRNYLTEAFNGKKVAFDIFRSAYSIHYRKLELTFNEREKIARAMRHSMQTADKDYQKIKGFEEMFPFEPIIIPQPEPPKQIIVIPAKEKPPPKEQFNQKEWMLKYRETEKGKESLKKAKEKYNQAHKEDHLRRKIINYANKYQDAEPTKKSIEKYNLKKVDGIWE